MAPTSFSSSCKTYKRLGGGGGKVRQSTTPTRHKMVKLRPENIRLVKRYYNDKSYNKRSLFSNKCLYLGYISVIMDKNENLYTDY